ncbi:MAG TPA: hypothetical protein VFE33_07205 [Thermoanaerobaculia bacterium]|nr:hypothetical protein [Thermoanaerobaculia bacterium]
METLIAVMTCAAYRDRADAQRATWVKDIPAGQGYRFFVGQGGPAAADTIVLDVPDDYRHFTLKVQAMRRWAYDRGYEAVCKIDDDCYVRPERLLAAVPVGLDYVGRTRGPSGNKPARYNSGFCYWMSRRAIEALLDVPWDRDVAEDRWAANELRKQGIRATLDSRYVVSWSLRNSVRDEEGPCRDNDVIAACEFEPQMMRQVHDEFVNRRESEATNLRPCGADPCEEGVLS